MNETEHTPNLPQQPLNKPISDSTDKCTCCPQCGSASYTHKNYLGDGFRLCQQCKQEWWIDIKYKKYYQFNGIEVPNIELQELQQNDSDPALPNEEKQLEMIRKFIPSKL